VLDPLSSGDFCRALGLNRQALMQHERRALVKLRALVGGTEDFPLLRETFLPSLERALAADLEAAAANRHVHRVQSAAARQRRRTAANCTG
jgi:hypothetical protein